MTIKLSGHFKLYVECKLEDGPLKDVYDSLDIHAYGRPSIKENQQLLIKQL